MSTQSWTYIEVGVDRIQRYLSRTTDLKGRRGASAWLSHATDRKRLTDWVNQSAWAGAGLEVNKEAGLADGVVPLRIPPTQGAAQPVAQAVMDDLRFWLPALELRARWAPGETYLQAYRSAFATGAATEIISLPAAGDFPPLRSCERCRADPAVDRLPIHEDKPWVCADCRARYDQRYRWPGLVNDWVPVGEERRLLAGLTLTRSDTAKTFEDLARLGSADGPRNHLATVAIDGNAMGELFSRVSAGDDKDLKARLSKQVSTATRAALQIATSALLGPDNPESTVPVIPHLVGGDDLLLSVVADHAWTFVTCYLEQFSRLVQDVDGLAPYLAEGPPSASAGIVFAHMKFPFRRAVELAETALRAAKKAHAGRIPAIAWLDVTRDGETAPPHRAAWTLTALKDSAEHLRALAGVDPAGRATLERLIDPKRPDLSIARLREHARRLDRTGVLDPFLTDGRASHQVAAQVADALALVRWWR